MLVLVASQTISKGDLYFERHLSLASHFIPLWSRRKGQSEPGIDNPVDENTKRRIQEGTFTASANAPSSTMLINPGNSLLEAPSSPSIAALAAPLPRQFARKLLNLNVSFLWCILRARIRGFHSTISCKVNVLLI